MFLFELITWIAVGLVVGAFAHAWSSDRGVGLRETLIAASVGSALGGLIGLPSSGRSFSGQALIAAITGSFVLLVVTRGYHRAGLHPGKKGSATGPARGG
jgi:uncharacterized membrane protein YeaQ/YmgE (transglycosylase-associated protein family)